MAGSDLRHLRIGAVVWPSLYAVLRLLWESEPVRLSGRDLVLLGAASLLFVVPVTAASSIGLTTIGVYFSIYGRTVKIRAAMQIQTALTVAMM